jgi:hypothetical protein
MTDREKKAFLLLRKELEDMRIFHQGFGFGIMTCFLHRKPNGFWDAVRRTFAFAHRNNISWSANMTMSKVDSFRGGDEAVRWWGDRHGIELYKAWAGKAYAFIKNHSTLLAVQHSNCDWYDLLLTLCAYAVSCPKLSMFLAETVMDDDYLEDFHNKLFWVDAESTEKTLKITVVDVLPDALTFSLRFVDHLLGVDFHHLEIDKSKNIAVLDGIAFPLKKHPILILALLLDAKDHRLSGPEMIKAEPELKRKRIDRLVDNLPIPLFELFDPDRKKGYRLLLP